MVQRLLASSAINEPSPRSFKLTRRSATVTISAPDAISAAFVCSTSRYLPVPTIRRELNENFPIFSGAKALEDTTLLEETLLEETLLEESAPLTRSLPYAPFPSSPRCCPRTHPPGAPRVSPRARSAQKSTAPPASRLRCAP